VKLSQEATSHGLNRRNRGRRIEGIIISPLPVQQIVTVLWDGWTKTESWHLDFLEQIPTALPTPPNLLTPNGHPTSQANGQLFHR
jgi:hypothetical protein